MRVCIRIDDIPEGCRNQALLLGKTRGVRLDMDAVDYARLCKGKTPVPKPAWPMWARVLAKQKSDKDKGVGDTAERVFGRFGGSQFKKALKKIGVDCGCTARQADWNQKFAYEKG